MKINLNFNIEISPEELIAAIRDNDFADLHAALDKITNSPRKESILEKSNCIPVGGAEKVVIVDIEKIDMESVPVKSTKTPHINTPEKGKSNVLKGRPAATISSKKCPQCQTGFKPTSNAQVFCSAECKKLSKQVTPPHEVKKDPEPPAESEHIPPKHEQKKNKKKPYIKRVKELERKCKKCGASFLAKTSQKYCSYACGRRVPAADKIDLPKVIKPQKIQKPIEESKPITRICISCGNEFVYSGTQKFCTVTCRTKGPSLENKREPKKEVTPDPEVFLDKSPDTSKSFYQQKLEEQRRQKAEAEQIESFRDHPKINWKQLENKYPSTEKQTQLI